MRLLLLASVVVLGVLLVTAFGAHGEPRTPPPAPAVERQPAPPRRRPTPAPPPRVTVIGDSVADEISYVGSARVLLGRGVRLRLELAACRRLVEPSCTVAGVQPTTTLDLIHDLGRALGPVVVVSVGYNDDQLLYAHDVKAILAALDEAGVHRVFWLTLRAERHPYLAMNGTLRSIAARDPHLTVVDWNRYSRSHPTWFDSDGLHLTPSGAIGMARLLHRTLTGASAPPG
jgi:hypothetical protein